MDQVNFIGPMTDVKCNDLLVRTNKAIIEFSCELCIYVFIAFFFLYSSYDLSYTKVH